MELKPHRRRRLWWLAHEFTLRSAFWFSSIDIPPLKPQDRSRLAILELKKLAKGAPPPP